MIFIMRCAGIDIGSRTIELVIIDGEEIIEVLQTDSGFDPLARARELLEKVQYDRIMATGYGRHLFELFFGAQTVTEIRAYAIGAGRLLPGTRTIVDIGGQDSKAIALNGDGKVIKFEMNDRCAAGTGKFLEIMAQTLGYDIESFGGKALEGKGDININSLCTVFAESEVTSLLARGAERVEIALALHESVVRRAAGMMKRVSEEEPILFGGGVALNPCIHRLLEKSLDRKITVPERPQMVGAVGAAILAAEIRND
jgi:(R)-2-hydroxyacyl-CoA dehydratese activating ATPase